MTLEDNLMNEIRAGRDIDIERGLLIVSGCDTEERISDYKAKLGRIEDGFLVYANANFIPLDDSKRVAEALHDYFWHTKPSRGKKGKSMFDKAIDAQLSGWRRKIGNCTGLTSLYTCLGVRNNLEMRALLMPRHVASRVIIGKEKVDIENTEKYGFGWDFSRKYAREVGLPALVACVINNRGDVFYKRGEFEKAMQDYGKAIQINPQFAEVFYNRGLAREKLGDLKEAEEDFEMYKKLKGESR